MLDAETKRRIDTARDILVGKVPDPKSQVEQITIALIYKFMDDMDAESEELGGNRKFFAGEFAQYGWPKLVRSGLGGHEVLNLYSEAITRMPENPGIPPLFRDIFKNAFLPYRDPETLRAFLKIIDEFEYDHSERLGDAFEYLLSVLGSQGDAGQFRTPRHIIDFIVSVVDPKKDETVLDPACGTAGFLISSYKHILKSNTDEKGQLTLTPDEKGSLADNFKGYDISPDMVRLSLVNLYLHGFVAPQVYEYDTLTSEDRWNEYADVILANPPFMSPKGGIRPHNRFSVKSKRSEVLFVDYMAEHLTPNGRAGIIVPEGIIFQSQNAYKQLRKMLVEEYLVAVISLPAGVFNPYSGVKTSILILDKVLARRRDSIGFFKVENDGFDLGSQRRAIGENDLPEIEQAIREYLNMDEQGMQDEEPSEAMLNKLTGQGSVQIVAKERIAANGEYILSGERYRESRVSSKTKWPMVELRHICGSILSGGTPSTKNEDYWKGDIPWITSADILNLKIAKPRKYITQDAIKESATNLIPKGNLIVATRVGLGKLFRNDFDVCISQDSQGLILKDVVNADYLVHVLKDKVENFKNISQGSTIQGVTKKQLAEIEIPLPPMEVQREIVAEIEGYQKVIDGARAVVENYRPNITIDPDWPMVKIRRACIVNPRKSELADLEDTTIVSFVPMSDIGENAMYFDVKNHKHLHEVSSSYTYFMNGDVLIAKVTPCFENGKAGIAKNLNNSIGFGSSEFYVLRPTKAVISQWIYLSITTPSFREWAIPQMTGTGGLQRVPRSIIENYRIPLPPKETQQTIIAEIEAEQSIVSANQELIEQMERKILATVERVWGKAK